MATKIGSFLEKIANKSVVEITKTGAESAKAALEFAKTLKEKSPDVATLKPYAGQMTSLLELLNSPIAQIVKDAIPFAPIAVTLLNLVHEATKQELTLEECMALVVQLAYLDSVRVFLSEIDVAQNEASQSVSRQIRSLAEVEMNDRDARTAILFFHESEIAKAFSAVLEARLTEVGCSDVRRSAELVARNTNYYIQTALAGMGEKVNPVVKWFSTGGQEKFEQYLSIEEYLRDVISPDSTIHVLRDRWRVFNEPFTLKEIYVPTEARFINKDGEQDEERDPVVLEQWAKAWLNQPEQSKVLFIQGHPGRGKSVFCRMFAEWVRVNEHPNWTPILIRLRDIQSLEKDFEETLRKAVNRNFAASDQGWLSDRNTRFLFLLDGFDELLMQGRTSNGLEEFLEQAEKFQRRCQENFEKGHRVLITGRTLSLQSIERKMPTNLERLEIIEMSDELQGQWFAKWVQLAGSEKTSAFQQFLHSEQCPKRVRELSREPLLLYLLAAMHRDGELTLSAFEGAEGVQAKILIYEKTIDWVLTKQRPDMLNRELTELETEDLRLILAEAGYCVQSGDGYARIAMIESRLKGNSSVQCLLEEARQRLKDNPLRNSLAAFYLQPGSQRGGSVEFIHKSFGEFLCAERLKIAIESWTEPGKRRQEFYVSPDQFNWEIYDLFGTCALSPEIVDYLMALLGKSEGFEPFTLFKRLNEFYLRWCNGEFLDVPNENLFQRKVRSIREQIPELLTEEVVDIRCIDVVVGLNVLILLFQLNQYAQSRHDLKDCIKFYPCSQRDSSDFDAYRLLKVIGYSHCIHPDTFCRALKNFLGYANFGGANLRGIFLRGADLRDADLSNTFLRGAYLSESNLSRANFSGAVMYGTFLNEARLQNANFTGADLFKVSMMGAHLQNADFSSANLRGIAWSVDTNWEGVRGLETARNVPIALKQQLGLE